MDKLTALIEKRGVIFVSFNHKRRLRIAQSSRLLPPTRDAADQKSRMESSFAQDPSEHGSSGRLAVRSCNSKHRPSLLSGKNVFTQPLRARSIRKAGIENGLQKRIAAGDGIADHPKIRSDSKLLGTVPFSDGYTVGAQRIAHRGIDVFVTPGHLVAGFAGDLSDAAHESAADAENMDMHRKIPRIG